MRVALEIAQIVIACLLVGLILLQARGTGLSATFGGSNFATSKRGVERIIFIFTICLLILLSISSILLTLL